MRATVITGLLPNSNVPVDLSTASVRAENSATYHGSEASAHEGLAEQAVNHIEHTVLQ